MRTSIEIEGLDEVSRRIKSVLSPLEGKDVTDVLVKGARIIRDDAKQRAPKRTGKLRRSIKAKRGKKRGKLFSTAFAAVDVKVARYAYLVEYGTRHSAPKPYFRPAVDAKRDEVMRTVNDGIAELIGRAAR